LQINWVAIAIYHDIFHDKCLLLFSYLYLQVYSLVQVTRPLHILRGLVAKLTRCDVRLHILLGQHGVPTFYYETQVSRSCPFYLTSSPTLAGVELDSVLGHALIVVGNPLFWRIWSMLLWAKCHNDFLRKL
jgi:hypothetical protein